MVVGLETGERAGRQPNGNPCSGPGREVADFVGREGRAPAELTQGAKKEAPSFCSDMTTVSRAFRLLLTALAGTELASAAPWTVDNADYNVNFNPASDPAFYYGHWPVTSNHN